MRNSLVASLETNLSLTDTTKTGRISQTSLATHSKKTTTESLLIPSRPEDRDIALTDGPVPETAPTHRHTPPPPPFPIQTGTITGTITKKDTVSLPLVIIIILIILLPLPPLPTDRSDLLSTPTTTILPCLSPLLLLLDLLLSTPRATTVEIKKRKKDRRLLRKTFTFTAHGTMKKKKKRKVVIIQEHFRMDILPRRCMTRSKVESIKKKRRKRRKKKKKSLIKGLTEKTEMVSSVTPSR